MTERAAPTLPLTGRRIVVTRGGARAADFAERLRTLGAEPISCPAIAIAPPEDSGPLDRALAALDRYDWLACTSANGVAAIADRLAAHGGAAALPAHLRLAAVGPATARAMAEALHPPDIVPAEGHALALGAALGPLAGRRILLPLADIARPDLADALRAGGALVDAVIAYRTIPADPAPIRRLIPLLHAGSIDAVTFTSPSTVLSFLAALEGAGLPASNWSALPHPPLNCCIGQTTAEVVREAGLIVAALAPEPTNVGLVAALLDVLSRASPVAGEDNGTAETRRTRRE